MILPPWIKAADPAAHMAQGMHIGIQIGAQQAEERFKQQQLAARQAQADQEMSAQEAAQRFKEVQAAKNEQMAARDQSLAEQKFSLAASSAAQKHQAMQEYQSFVAGGGDPNEGMLRWGPAMAQSTGAAAAIRAHERESRAPITFGEATLPSGLKLATNSRGAFQQVREPTLAKVQKGAAFVPAGEDGSPAHWELGEKSKSEMTAYQNIMERDRTERAIDKLIAAQPTWSEDEPPSGGNKLTQNQWKVWKKQVDALRKRIDGLEGGGAPAAAQAPGQAVPGAVTPPGAQKIGRFTVMPAGAVAAPAPAAQAGTSAGDVPPPMVRGPVRMPPPAAAQVPVPPPQAAAPSGPQYSYPPAQQVAMALPPIQTMEPVTRATQIKQARQIAEKLPEDKLIETASHTVGDKVEKISGGRFRVWNGDAKQDVTRKQLERMIAEQ